MYRKWSSSNY